MPALATILPSRRAELVLTPLGDRGQYVVKDPRTGAYYHLGAEEHFLLSQLDGECSAEKLCLGFADRFGHLLGEEELQEFLQMAQGQGLLQPVEEEPGRDGRGRPDQPRPSKTQGVPPTHHSPLTPLSSHHSPLTAHPTLQSPLTTHSVLYWRKNFFDPDRLFTWLAPKIWFCWTPAFLVFSACAIVLATALLWANRQGVAGSFLSALRWETAILAWLVLMVVTTCHEFAHGLTCKHYGGEVHEVGFLLIFLMPCFYCNVSDAWLFKEKSKRLWVTLAGGYFELFLWSLAVFVWRLTLPGSLPNYLAFIVLSACGVQTLFNFNPLLKLDGYYLLSDWLEVPNLQQRAGDYIKGQMRWLLWGAARPDDEGHGSQNRGTRRVLLTYGGVSSLYSLVFLVLMIVGLTYFLGPRWGVLGIAAALLLGVWSVRGLLQGFSAGEVNNMIRRRHKRTVVWLLVLGLVPAVLFVTRMEDRAGGSFQVRPASRAELRAPVAGFLQTIYVDEGDRVSPGGLVARLEVPDLASRLAQKRAELNEAQAKLRLLEIGPRHEEVVEQRRRVERAKDWRDLAQQGLRRGRRALEEELARLDKQVAQHQAELDFAQDVLGRANKLKSLGALSEEERREAEKKVRISRAQIEQVQAQKRARRTLSTQLEEAELARREKELADAQATSKLLEAGSRPEEIEAERARRARLQEEARYLQGLQDKVQVTSPVAGVITTPHLKEKIGQYVREGDLIGIVEEPAALEAEIAVTEQEAARIRPGQAVELKARALPFTTLSARVDRIAPCAGRGEVQSTVTVYCELEDAPAELRPGMSGYARIYCGPRSLGEILVDRVLRYVRTEFWW